MSMQPIPEDIADTWLRENDPYYKDARKNKRKSLNYSYETMNQERHRQKKEWPFSNLSKSTLYKLEDSNIDIKPFLE